MAYKYKVGHKFSLFTKNNLYEGKIIKIASLDECECDFHYSESNYVVEFDINNKPISTYNILESNNGIIKYTYIMNENDMDKTWTIDF